MSGTQLNVTTLFTFTHTAAQGSAALDAEVVAVLDIARSGTGFTAIERFTVEVGALPDQISFTPDGTRLLTANEGDARDWPGLAEEVRVSSLTLDPTAFPDAAALKADAELGPLVVTNWLGDTDGDGDFDRLHAFGGCSFSVWTTDGRLVFDSGRILDHIVAELGPPAFDDGRDDNKGSEPEALAFGEVGGKHYLFVGLERADGVAAFRINGPDTFTYAGFVTTPGDLEPQAIAFVPAADSPTGEALLVAANEGSGAFTLQILHASDFEAGVEAVDRAANFAAVVQALEGTYANSITLSSGDHFIPGPFTAASTDAGGRDELVALYQRLLGVALAEVNLGQGAGAETLVTFTDGSSVVLLDYLARDPAALIG